MLRGEQENAKAPATGALYLKMLTLLESQAGCEGCGGLMPDTDSHSFSALQWDGGDNWKGKKNLLG